MEKFDTSDKIYLTLFTILILGLVYTGTKKNSMF